jgi:phospholipid/cholesterol/gamma-HCH transport system substrate-binding protein
VKASKEIKIGLTVIVAIVFLIVGINYLKGINLFRSNRMFTAKYEQIDGLVTASPVIYKGMKVGQVTEVEIMNGGEYINVTFVIDNDDIQIPVDSKATIFSSDLLGTRAISLDFGTSKTMAEEGAVLTGANSQSLGDRVNQEIAPVKKKAEELLGSLDTLVTSVKTVIGDNQSGLNASITSVQRTVKSLENTANTLEDFINEEKPKISATFTNVRSITNNLANNNDKINTIIDNFAKISNDVAKADLSKMIGELNATLGKVNNIIETIEKGEGSLGKLIKSDSLHNALLATNKKVQDLLDNITEHPTRYLHFSVFGAKEKGLKLTAAEEKELKDLLKKP